MSEQTLKAGENPTADAAAAEHVKGLYSTGMQFEFAPSTVATRAFLDGFALGAATLAESATLERMAATLSGTEQGAACEFAVKLMREREDTPRFDRPWFSPVPRSDKPTFAVQLAFGPGERNSWLRGIDTAEEAAGLAQRERDCGRKARVWSEYIVREIVEVPAACVGIKVEGGE